ncbi:MAG: hypothetical protein O2955_06915 [Planctomycetota bacterium]|nr:hypothetical protein [Planctomycetota bacterium]MDA1212227.1 hypothetical protein [Planctomycetota bacterium]
MVEKNLDQLIQRAEAVYASRLRTILEPDHLNEFVSIEPESGDYYLGKTLSDAITAARTSHPGRLVHTMRVGHKAAVHFGMQSR